MKNRITALFLAFIAIISALAFTSCGETKEKSKENGTGETEGVKSTEADTFDSEEQAILDYIATYNPEETAESYVDTDVTSYNFEGYNFTFLNSAPIYNMYIYLDPEMTGDVLDDCCYERNFMTEKQFNITINEDTQPYEELAGFAKTLILSGESVYDAMYIPAKHLTPLISENLFYDLLEIKELNIDKVWWDQPMIERNTIENRLFYATSDLSLMAFEGIWCMYFNEDMMISLGLDMPYQIALDGKWTFDTMKQYCEAAANLNGDAKFSGDPNEKATYGVVSLDRAPSFMAYGMATEFVKRDNSGKYYFAADTDPKFTNTWEKLISFWGPEDGLAIIKPSGAASFTPDGYYGFFESNRALFISAEMVGATLLREWEGNFGLMPQPKYDENQATYNSTLFDNCLSFCIPSTNTDLSRTGIIVDYLTYMSYTSLLPRYYDIHVSLKALGKKESIDVLQLVRGTRGIEVSIPFCWSSDLFSAMNILAKNNEHSISSKVESYKDAVVSAINTTYTNYPTYVSVEGKGK